MILGAHLGIANGLPEAVAELKKIGGDALQIFSKSPQMWSGPAIAPESAAAFRAAVRDQGVRATAVHHGYLINLASPKRAGLARSRRAFQDEIGRAEMLGVDGLIFHPGARLDSTVEEGVATIVASVNGAIAKFPEGRVRLLLENAAGQGTTLCSRFEELQAILSRIERPERVGVTLDTCHLFAAGFDFRTDAGYGELTDRIRSTFGLEAVRAFHLNDAKAELGSHLDRHENIGKGEIGAAGFAPLLRDPRWNDVPGYLETPLDDRGYARYAEDLATLRAQLGGSVPAAGTGRSRARSRPASSTVK
ncbi:MAG TPA: deoxyribonuclease IV [Thermoplasmata archaeon]|nr:deoxyribonuclease IV [Thermoplasmata archaeon]